MEIPAIIVIIPVGLVFLISGLIINLIQAILYVLVRPLSKNMSRRFNKVVAELLWLETVWLFDWWAGIKVELHTDPETFRLMGKEHALLISNHRSDIDWLIGWVLAQRVGCLGSSMAIMKGVLKYLPVIGWSMWFSEYIFVKRRWAEDQSTLKLGYEKLKDFPVPFWLALFVEGTRFTQTKLLDAQKFAISKGLEAPRNVLLPRTKGLILAVKHMRSFVPAIYDVTLAIPKDCPPPSMLTMLKGKSSVVKLHIKRHLMQELPEQSDDIAHWCKDMFVAKITTPSDDIAHWCKVQGHVGFRLLNFYLPQDAFLDNYFSSGSFGSKEIQELGRPKQSLIVMIVWSCLLSTGAFGFLLWTRLFLTWQGIIISAVFLLLVIVTMEILILFSQAESKTDSAPIKILPQDTTKENLLKQ